MPSSFSPNLRFEEIQNGEQANTWGTTTNNNIGNLIGQAIAGLVQVDVTGADVTLLALDGAVDQARAMFIEVIGTPGATRYVSCPDGITKTYVVINNSDSPVVFDTVSGTGISVPAAGHQFLYTDGTNVLNAVTSIYTFSPNQALVSSSGGNITVSPTSAQQIAWLQNVTSDVQTQINSKPAKPTGTTAQLLANDGSGQFANVNIGPTLTYNPSTQTLNANNAGGSVTSVALAAPGGFTVTGSPITSNGTLTLALSTSLVNAGPLGVNGAGALAPVNLSGLTWNSSTNTLSVASAGVTSVNGLTGAVSLNYSNVGAPSTTGSGASGTWGINISGAAASATNANYASSAGSASTASSASYASSAGSASTATSADSAGYATGVSIGGYTAFCYNGGSNWLMIDGSGQLNTNSHPMIVGGTFTAVAQMYAPSMAGASGTQVNWNSATGQLTHATSSLRYKTDIKDAWYGLKEVLTLRPVTFMEKARQEQYKDNRVFGGLIAEEVDAAGLTEFVQYNAEGAPESLSYDHMVSLLVNAVKELNAKIEALEAKVGA